MTGSGIASSRFASIRDCSHPPELVCTTADFFAVEHCETHPMRPIPFTSFLQGCHNTKASP